MSNNYYMEVKSFGHYVEHLETDDFDTAYRYYMQNYNLDTCVVVVYIDGERINHLDAHKLFGRREF